MADVRLRHARFRPDLLSRGSGGGLHRTVLWRDDVERYVASGVNDARMLVSAAEPQVIVVDLEMPGAEDLLRSCPRTPGRGRSWSS